MKLSDTLKILEKKIEKIEKKIYENENSEFSNFINHSKDKFKNYAKKDKLSQTKSALISFFGELEKIWSEEDIDEKPKTKKKSKKIKIEKK